MTQSSLPHQSARHRLLDSGLGDVVAVDRALHRGYALGKNTALAAWTAEPAAVIRLERIALMGRQEEELIEPRATLALDVSQLVPAIHTTPLSMHDHCSSFP